MNVITRCVVLVSLLVLQIQNVYADVQVGAVSLETAVPSHDVSGATIQVAQEAQKGVNVLDVLTEQAKKQLKLFWEALTWDNFRKRFAQIYGSQIVGTKATVEKGVRLNKEGFPDRATEEGKFLARREIIALKALEEFMKHPFEDRRSVPRIGCAFSGGGYRAMILTSGYLQALETLGLLDAVLYISTLSGSTWYLGPWTLQQMPSEQKRMSVAAFNQKLIEKIQTGHFNMLSPSAVKDFDQKVFASEVIWPKVLFNQVISSVDIYGGALAHLLLADHGKRRQEQTLSDQLKSVELGNHPWPLYTAVSMHKSDEPKDSYRYNWYEFNPVEVRNLEQNFAISSYAFGRNFQEGRSNDFPPEQSFGFLMGIFGSAYTVGLPDVIRIYFGKDFKSDAGQANALAQWYKKSASWANSGIAEVKKMFQLATKGDYKKIWDVAEKDLGRIKGAFLAEFLGAVGDVTIKLADRNVTIGGKTFKARSARFSPAQIFNPFKGYSEAPGWLKVRELLTFVDAGIDYNIPLCPLLRPERDLDLIIIGDASGDVPAGTAQLDLALADAKRFYGITYTKDVVLSSKTVMVFRPDQDIYPKESEPLRSMKPPFIFYVNFLKDEALLKDKVSNKNFENLIKTANLENFDAKKCLGEEFCGTFNFAYSVGDFRQLSGIGEFNVRVQEATLRKLLEECADWRTEQEGIGS